MDENVFSPMVDRTILYEHPAIYLFILLGVDFGVVSLAYVVMKNNTLVDFMCVFHLLCIMDSLLCIHRS